MLYRQCGDDLDSAVGRYLQRWPSNHSERRDCRAGVRFLVGLSFCAPHSERHRVDIHWLRIGVRSGRRQPRCSGCDDHRRGEWPVGVHTAGAFFLAGVFLSDSVPVEPAPATLDFTNDGLGKSFDSLIPELAQVFFIGDGRTADDSLQNFFVPAGATRLVLGTIDNCGGGISAPGCYFDNVGGFDVTFTVAPVPLPPSFALFVVAGLTLIRRHKGGW